MPERRARRRSDPDPNRCRVAIQQGEPVRRPGEACAYRRAPGVITPAPVCRQQAARPAPGIGPGQGQPVIQRHRRRRRQGVDTRRGRIGLFQARFQQGEQARRHGLGRRSARVHHDHLARAPAPQRGRDAASGNAGADNGETTPAQTMGRQARHRARRQVGRSGGAETHGPRVPSVAAIARATPFPGCAGGAMGWLRSMRALRPDGAMPPCPPRQAGPAPGRFRHTPATPRSAGKGRTAPGRCDRRRASSP